jgi:hypothetical protein
MRVVRALVARDGVPATTGRLEDARGSAKLALMMVQRSRVAWESLRGGKLSGDIDRMVALLDDLERGIDDGFPDARTFVRVGLDVPAA